MRLTPKNQKICDKYSAYDEEGNVHCSECPLKVGNPDNYDFRCKANSHYSRKRKEWVFDEHNTGRD